MRNLGILTGALVLGLSLWPPPVHAQLTGTDVTPGSSCSGFPTGATRLVADVDLDGRNVVLICSGGGTWVAANADFPALSGTDRGLVFNSVSALAVAPDIVYSSNGNIGIRTTSPVTLLDVNGEIRAGTSILTCNTTSMGAFRFDGTHVDKFLYCNGVSWVPFRRAGPIGVSWDRQSVVNIAQNHACALFANGAAWCWGQGSNGKLGNGLNTDSSTPVAVSGGYRYLSLSSGEAHTCGVTNTGAAYCWGTDAEGRLGTGATGNRSAPTIVTGGHLFRSLATGRTHSCGIVTDFSGYCWGDNTNTKLGCGPACPTTSTPTAVSGGYKFIQISAGDEHSCGVTSAGAIYCWGDNASGQLGNGGGADSNVPVFVSSSEKFINVSAGAQHSCAVSSGGGAYCWGANGSGQLGDGTNTPSGLPVFISTGFAFSQVSAANLHTCGLRSDGAAYCWGDNTNGELGNGNTSPQNQPVAVTGSHRFMTLFSGLNDNASCGMTSDSTAYCWGSGNNGKRGDGTTGSVSNPTAVNLPP